MGCRWKSSDALWPYALWRSEPSHPSLQFKCVSERHAVFSIRIGLNWRALGYRDLVNGEAALTWFWIGSHAEYDRLVARV